MAPKAQEFSLAPKRQRLAEIRLSTSGSALWSPSRGDETVKGDFFRCSCVSTPLPSDTPRCRQCGKPLEPGQLYGEGRGTVGTLIWAPDDASGTSAHVGVMIWPGSLRGQEMLDKEARSVFSKPTTFRGWRCTACRLVEFHYPAAAPSS